MKKKNFGVIAKALKVSFQTKGRFSMAVSLFGFPAAILPVLISVTLGKFTDSVQRIYQGQEKVSPAVVLLGAMVFFYVLQAIYDAADDYCTKADSAAVNCFIEESVMDCAASVQYKYIENEDNFREKLSFIEKFGADRVGDSMNQSIKLIRYILAFLSVAFALWAVDWRLVVLLVAAIIPAMWIANAQNDANYRNNTKSMKEASMSVYLFQVAAGSRKHCVFLNTVRFTNAYPWLRKKWQEASEYFIGKKKEIAKKYLNWNILGDILRNGVFLFVLLLAAYRIYQNPGLGLGLFTSVYLLSKQLQSAAVKILNSGSKLLGDIPYMKDFFALRDIPREPKEKAGEAIKEANIVCEHLSFSYPGAEKEALHDINLTIRQGEKIAIVGHNGSGKSTFVNLLCGMYEPSAGSVTVGGRRVYEALDSVRAAISVVFQNFGRYETTLRENITVGDQDRHESDEEILKLAAKTGADTVIREQEDGLSEEVGTFSKKGNNLSGGQWQKIALTRALYRKDSRVIILDEPTAALDPIAEAELYRNFTSLTEDKTTLLISHRLGITSVVDRILVFDGGRIVEDGSHEELMKLGGSYAKMYEAQAQWYQ